MQFKTVNLSAQPGKNITIWCQHTSETGINIHWFKQTNSSLKEIHKHYLNCFQQDRILMTLKIKNTSLRILNVDVSDSGLYFCGWDSRMMTFGDGTNLDIKERSVTPLQNETEITNKVKCDLILTDLKKSSISTRDCSENIFYKLTFIFGGIIVILIIIPLTMLIFKIQNTNTQEKGNSTSIHSEDLLALSKHKSRIAARNTEDRDVVYSATR
uniref:Ig-like domain-containing protein n=1 Tax=Cyprinus carpio carpio TaxID=630221 RepID=A0A8C1CSW4_CYPCA